MRSFKASSIHQIDGKDNEFEESNKKKKKEKKSLYGMFTNRIGSKESPKEMNRENPMVFKELSPEMKLIVSHLYKEGYLNDANFLTMENRD